MPMLSLIPQEAAATLEARFGAAYRGLNRTEVMALVTAQIEDAVSNTRLQDLLEDHPGDIGRTLQGLVAKGFLVTSGRGRWTRYQLPGRKIGDLFTAGTGGDSPVLPGDSPVLAGDSPVFNVQWGELVALATPMAARGRAPAEELRAVILDLCRHQSLTLRQLSELLSRTPKNLRDAHLSPMVREGALALKYPHDRNRPDQAYIVPRGAPEKE